MSADPSEDEVIGYLERFDRSAQPGADPSLGALARITPATRLRALATVRDGITIGCARPIATESAVEDVIDPVHHELIETGPMTSAAPVVRTASDRLTLPGHGVTVTHLDALGHFSVDGRVHGGAPTGHGSVEAWRDGILTRAVLVDVASQRGRPWLDAGDAIRPTDLERWEADHDVRLEPGDALLLRTGWASRRREAGPYPGRKPRPGLHAAVLPWLHEREVAVVVSDAAHDVVPSGYDRLPMPIHAVGLVAMGLCLVDNADLDALAAAMDERRRWTCCLVLAPLRIVDGTGSPVTPVAIL